MNTYKGKLGKEKAAHLLRRSTYVHHQRLIDEYAELSSKEAVIRLFKFKPLRIKDPIDPKNNQPYVNMSRGKPFKLFRNNGSKSGRLNKYLVGWWMNEAHFDETIKSKLSFFLHTCFSIRYNQTDYISPHHLFDHFNLLYKYTDGSYKELAYEMVVDNTMLEFLDNYTNAKDNPNENFAREYFELFTIGKGTQIEEGNYSTFTEDDVRVAARLLTGFVKGPINLDKRRINKNVTIKTDPCRGEANFQMHDLEDKSFSFAFQNTTISAAKSEEEMWRELQDFVNMIFKQNKTAVYLAKRIYRFFVNSKIDSAAEKEVIQPLASMLISNGYQLKPAIQELLQSEHFFSATASDTTEKNIGSKVKSPLELVMGTLTYFDVILPDANLNAEECYEKWNVIGLIQDIYKSMGFNPFSPQDVAGYPPYYQEPDYDRQWFNSSSIVGRYQFIEKLLQQKKDSSALGGVWLDSVAFVKNKFKNIEDSQALVNTLTTEMFPKPCNPERILYFENILLDNNSKDNWKREWKKFLNTDKDDIVRRPLDRLIKALVNSHEYQLM